MITRTSTNKLSVMALVAVTTIVTSVFLASAEAAMIPVNQDHRLVEVDGDTNLKINDKTKKIRKLRGAAADSSSAKDMEPMPTLLEELEFWDRHLQGSAPAPAPTPRPGPTGKYFAFLCRSLALN